MTETGKKKREKREVGRKREQNKEAGHFLNVDSAI